MISRVLRFFLLVCLTAVLAGCPPTTRIVTPPEPDKPPPAVLPSPTPAPTPVQSAKLQPILRLDTGGHTGIIKDLIVTSDKKYLISCSSDKTIRVWDTETKKESRKILGEIGKGLFGMTYAIALSPDDRYLAVGGFLAQGFGVDGDKVGNIRIYHFPSGELIRILKSHDNVVNDLAFSPDGRYLVSGSGDKTVKVWDVADEFKLVHTFGAHSDDVYAVRIFPHEGDYRVVSAAYDHKVFLYSLNKKDVLASFARDDRAYSLAVSPKHIACSGDNDNKINIFDLNLNHVKTIESETYPTGLAFSPDGKLLLAGTGASPRNCNIYDAEQNFKKIQSFQKHDNLTRAVAFLDDATAVTGGGNDYDIWFWDPRTGETKGRIAGGGKMIWSMGAKDGEIAFGNTSDYQDHHHRGPLERAFSLSDFKPFQPKDFTEFSRISTQYRDYALSHERGGPYGYNDGVLLVKKGEEIITRIERDSTNGVRHNCNGFTPDGVILSGGSNGHLKAYDMDGEEKADFAGHTGEVWAIALDGDRLVSAGADMVIHAWDLKKLRDGQTSISPSFSVFVSNDDEWVVWTPEGFFNASDGGAKFIGYHINRGKENAAEYIGVGQLFTVFYRPDLVTKRIRGGHEDEIAAELARVGDIDTIIRSGLPPEVLALNLPTGTLTDRNFTLDLKVTDKGGGIGKIVFRVDNAEYGMPEGERPPDVAGSRQPGEKHVKKKLTLDNGRHMVSAAVYNTDGTIQSKPVEFMVNVDDPRLRKPDLYGLCVGISKYRDGALRLKYAADDAIDMRRELETRAAPLFQNVKVEILTDSQATKKGIREAFKNISGSIQPNDVFVLFMSGHGKAINANYHFIPWEMRYENEDSIRKQGLTHEEIQELLAMIPVTKTLVILDTCYSASSALASAKGVLTKGIEEKTAIDRLMKATGRHTLAATSDLAYEHKGHGIFTYALLEGLKSQADRKGNKNGATGVNELADFVGDEVPRITQERFGCEMVPMRSSLGDPFDIGCREGYDGEGCKP